MARIGVFWSYLLDRKCESRHPISPTPSMPGRSHWRNRVRFGMLVHCRTRLEMGRIEFGCETLADPRCKSKCRLTIGTSRPRTDTVLYCRWLYRE